ncbi:MAG: polymer-forming cytoskeletal protein [Methylotenera sp.]|nr:polymer-forming cytoskeletal protein [Methylotenera sp.]MDD4926190.1 polymer-forming cytoskeletal protein [Methylotenera sp.]
MNKFYDEKNARPLTHAFYKFKSAQIISFIIMVFFFNDLAQAATYTLPANIGSSPFNNCSFLSGTTYNCTGDINIGKNHTINVTSPMTLNLTSGDFIADDNLTINSGGNNFTITAPNGDIDIGKDFTGSVNLQAGKSIKINDNATITGNINAGNNVEINKNSVITGNINAGKDIKVDDKVKITGNLTATDDIKIKEDSNIIGNLTAGDKLDIGKNSAVTGNCSPSHPQCTPPPLPPMPTAEYRFDEITWSGSSGQVIDTIASNNGTAMNGALTTSSTGVGQGICRLGVFDGVNDYVEVPTLYNQLKGTFSFSAWLNTTQVGNNVDWQAPGITGVEQNGGQDDIFIGWLDASGRIGLNVKNDNSFKSTSSVNNGQWHHVVFTRDMATGITKIYVDGALQNTRTQGTGAIGNTFNGIGIVRNTSPSNAPKYFNGKLDEILIFNNILTDANVTQIYSNQSTGKNWDGSARICSGGFDHIQIEHPSGNGVTCSPTTLTIKACANAACTTLYTGGVSGTLTATGTGTANWGDGTANFNIPASGSVTKTLQLTSVNTNVSTTLGATSITPAPTATTSCNFAGCVYTAFNSGFIFNILDHVAGVTQTVSISAVKKSDTSNACVPGLANVTRTLQMACSYINPSTGTLPMLVNGRYLNNTNSASAMCASSNPVSLIFNNTGIADATLSYPDVGNMRLTVAYAGSAATGDAGLSINGTDTFITAPKDFAFSSITAAPIKAGNNFSATVTARNNDNNLTPNFGNESSPESAAISFTKYQPTGVGAVNGSFSGTLGSFTNGVATSSNLNWSEVGLIDLNATLSSNNYLGSGLTANGSTGNVGAVGRFIPHHFDTVVTQGCSSGSFTYSAQPFNVQVRALNAANALTQNYDGSINTTPNFAKTITLSDSNASGLGSLLSPTIASSAFLAGVANATPNYSFTNAKTSPTIIKLRATDTDSVSSATGSEGTTTIRSGRLLLKNAYGSELLNLPIALEAQYWNGSSYIRNVQDNCTTLPSNSIAMSNYTSALAACETQIGYSTGSGALINGVSSFLRLTKPGAGNNGSADLSLNLNGAAGSTCTSSSVSSATNANLPWFGANPTSRATFGIYKTPIIYMRENY